MRREIEADQLAKLRSLLAVVSASNPFYSNKLRKSGILAEFSSLDEFFDRMPFTLKQELIEDQRASPPYGSNLTYPLERYTRLTQTSSTSGKALHWLDTPESWEWMLDNWQQVYQAAVEQFPEMRFDHAAQVRLDRQYAEIDVSRPCRLRQLRR